MLVVISFFTPSTPAIDDPIGEAVASIRDDEDGLLLSVYLSGLASIAFLPFLSALWPVLRQDRGPVAPLRGDLRRGQFHPAASQVARDPAASGASGQFRVQLYGEPAPGAPAPAPTTPAPPPSTAPVTKVARAWGTTYKAAVPSGGSLIVGSPPLNGREDKVQVKVALDEDVIGAGIRKELENELKLALALVRNETSERQLRADCIAALNAVNDPDNPVIEGRSVDDTLVIALKSCLERVRCVVARAAPRPNEHGVTLGRTARLASNGGCGLSVHQILIKRLSGRRVRSELLPRGTPGPRSPARATCKRSSKRLTVGIAPRSEDRPLREIVGDRLRIGFVRPPSAEGDARIRIGFGRS